MKYKMKMMVVVVVVEMCCFSAWTLLMY